MQEYKNASTISNVELAVFKVRRGCEVFLDRNQTFRNEFGGSSDLSIDISADDTPAGKYQKKISGGERNP